MNSEISKLLQEIKERPGVYFGRKTLNGVTLFIDGYTKCMYDRDGVHPECFQDFQEFVEKYYDIHDNIHLKRHWTDIITFFNPSEEGAFDEFYKLLDDFVKEEAK